MTQSELEIHSYFYITKVLLGTRAEAQIREKEVQLKNALAQGH
jgi:hypothetical protein